ncbi:hypothetical protein BH11ARM2_BH11ARM2_30950 [soil metagenome]
MLTKPVLKCTFRDPLGCWEMLGKGGKGEITQEEKQKKGDYHPKGSDASWLGQGTGTWSHP